ncbi:MAG: GGDEF domain-containing protein [Lachnospiraceae bacterium]|nr:GGDEF domain-containing protein [Lachnospiraceae bacterium]
MERDNCELLFQYLKRILYDRHIEKLEPEAVDEPFQKLAKGLGVLQQQVEELHTYTSELSRGNLSAPFPPRDNFLCEHLKNLHANLNHLTWQAKQVAAGDYSQHVAYLGEFSEAFNTMIRQLQERESLLKQEAEYARNRAKVITEYNDFLIEMTRRRKEWVIVVDAETRQIVYCNKQQLNEEMEKPDTTYCVNCTHKLTFQRQILDWQDSEQYKEWQCGDEKQGYFQISTFHIEWRQRNAYAHIIEDITNEKRQEQRLANMAYIDSGTGLYNRQFFNQYMRQVLHERRHVTLCYLDLDGLKYVNDRYGHNEGDVYIRSVVDVIRHSFRSTDVFARIGGDEFCLILSAATKHEAEIKLHRVLEYFVKKNKKEYPVSYGIVEIHGKRDQMSLEEIVHQADERMYECKRVNKQKYHGMQES